MLNVPFDKRFEDKLIEEYAKEIYEECHEKADRRYLEKDYVIAKFISAFQSLARKDGII